MENDSFELLLRKDILHDSKEQVELRLAIFRYLQSHHPSDSSKLELLYISFKMYRERADSLFHKAQDSIKHISSFDFRNPQHSQTLNNAIVTLLDASDCYAKEKSFKHSKHALDLASLLSVQLKEPNSNMLHLTSADEIYRIFRNLSSLEDARDFAEFYDLNYTTNWIENLYVQVICNNNFLYLNDYIECFTVTPQTWVSITQKVKFSYFFN